MRGRTRGPVSNGSNPISDVLTDAIIKAGNTTETRLSNTMAKVDKKTIFVKNCEKFLRINN
jgi:hypothetical protein